MGWGWVRGWGLGLALLWALHLARREGRGVEEDQGGKEGRREELEEWLETVRNVDMETLVGTVGEGRRRGVRMFDFCVSDLVSVSGSLCPGT